eukprot:704751_1
MGSCVACATEEEKPEMLLASMINREIRHDKRKMRDIKKIPFLGSSGSGKSALLRKIRVEVGEFKDADREVLIKHIHSCVINEMKLALNVYIDYNHKTEANHYKYDQDDDDDDINFTSEPLIDVRSADTVLTYQYDETKHCLEQEIASAIQALWAEDIIKEIYSLRDITKIDTSAAHFWDKMDEIRTDDYIPS